MEKRLALNNDIAEIRKLADFIQAIAGELELSSTLAMNINMAMEEAVSNVILYAYPDGKNHEIIVEAQTIMDTLIFKVIDTGIAFNPTLHTKANIDLPIDERPIGGLGIFLIRQVMDKIEYERIKETNILTLTKKI